MAKFMKQDGMQTRIETNLDMSDMTITIPTRKLDADQYSADDLDGVTESLFGSGNMAYASLQASQTDALLAGGGGDYQQADLVLNADKGNQMSSNTDRPLTESYVTDTESLGTEGSFANTTVGSLGASTLSSDVGAFSPDSNLSIRGENFFKGTATTSQAERSGGQHDSGEAVSVDNSTQSDTTQNITNTTIDNSVHLGDDITEIIEGDIVEEVVNTITNEIHDVTETISTTVNNVTEIINDILLDTGITTIVNNVTEVVNHVTDSVTNIVDHLIDGTLSLDLDADILETLTGDVGIVIEDSVAGNIDIGATTENLSSIVNDLTGLSISSLSILDSNIGFDLLSGENIDDGNDISIAGLATPDIDLDIIEDIVGDIDISLDLPTELLDGEILVDTVQETVGSLSDLNIPDVDDVIETLGDEGVDGAVEAVIGDTVLGDDFDIDVDDILGGLGLGDGEDDPDDPDTGAEPVSDIADPLTEGTGDVVDGLTGGATDEITDTVTDIVDDISDVGDHIVDGLVGDVFGQDNDEGTDSDLVAGLDTDIVDTDIIDGAVDVILDPVEDLIGDVDLEAVGGLDLFGGNETGNNDGDTDITVNADADLVDGDIAEALSDIPLDPVEEIVGDVDIDAGAAADLLDDIADSVVNDGEGGTGEETILSETGDALGDLVEDLLDVDDDGALNDVLGLLGDTDEAATQSDGTDTPSAGTDADDDIGSWTETTVGDGGLFDDVVDGIGGGDSDALPDPLGTVGEGLGILDTDSNAGSDGGLFGGGLFG